MAKKTHFRNAMIKAEVKLLSEPEEFEKALREALAPKTQSFEDILAKTSLELVAFLKKRGCPHPAELCMFKGVHWCELPIGWDQMDNAEKSSRTLNTTIGLGYAYISKNFEPTDREAIAADICFRIFCFPQLSAEQKPEAAFHIGRLSQLLSSLRHLGIVEYGRNDKRTKSKAGENTSKRLREERKIEQSLSLMKHYIEEKGFSVSNAAIHAAKKHAPTNKKKAISAETMRSRWYAAKKKNRQKKPV